jgi:hypothetical protein
MESLMKAAEAQAESPQARPSGLVVVGTQYHSYGKEHPHAYTGFGYNVMNNEGEMVYGPETPDIAQAAANPEPAEPATATPEGDTPETPETAAPSSAPNIDPNALIGALMQALTGRREQQEEAEKYVWAGGEPTRYDSVKSADTEEKEITRVGMLYAIPRAEIVWAENPYMGEKKNREAIVWGVDNSDPDNPKEYTYYVQNNTVYNLEAFRDGRSEWVDFSAHGDEPEEEIPSFTIGGEPWKLPGHMPPITVSAVEVSAGRADEYANLTDEMLKEYESRGKDPFDQAHDLVRGLLEQEEAERRAGGPTPPQGPRLRLVVNEEDLTPTPPAQPATPPQPTTPPAPAQPVIIRRRPISYPPAEPKGLRARATRVMNGIRATGARIRATGARAMRAILPWA